MREKLRILVVGGTRFFGIPMTEALLRRGHQITLAVRGSHGNPFAARVQQVTMDKTDAESVRAALGGSHFDVVIDKVAYASNDVRSLLENVRCERYIQMSSCAVYPSAHLQITEQEFQAESHPLVWMNRPADYAEGKRQAERAALEYLAGERCTFVRYPVVMGSHDYTGRLRFYAEHLANQQPICMQHPAVSAAYIHEQEAGEFLAYLAEHPCAGAVNGASAGMISQQEIIAYIAQHLGKTAVLSAEGDTAPYDGNPADISYDCTKAQALGFQFSDIRKWIFGLIDEAL